MKTHLFLGVVLVQFLAVGQTLIIEQSQCMEINELAMANVAGNRLEEAETAISAAASKGKYICAGVALGNIAVLLSIRGRIRDSEAFAARSVDLLRKHADPNDPMLFRSLHVLAIARLEQGRFRKAEQAFEQMLQLRAERPEQRGQVHLTGGMLRQLQGDLKEAESEYLLAYEEWKQSGKTADADAAAILNYLGALYITEERFKEASQVLDRALAIVAAAEDAIPLDRIKLLNLRAAAHARQGEWLEAQEKLRLAIAIAESEAVSEPVLLRSVLSNYAIALRKNHHRKEARSIERRASALPPDPPTGAVIDIRELSAGLRTRQH
ncbi:MAG TPA: tetratricopeptide repeat protein [Bryobacteraceae bacterium]